MVINKYVQPSILIIDWFSWFAEYRVRGFYKYKPDVVDDSFIVEHVHLRY